MTTRWPSGCLSAVSSIPHPRNASRLIVASPIILRIPRTRQYGQSHVKQHPQRQAKPETALPPPDAVKSAFEIVSAGAAHDPINPPRSTLPPPLTLPTRGSENTFIYLFNLGRAYGSFYKDGIKAVWYNYKAARMLWDRLKETGGVDRRHYTAAVHSGLISRSEYQLLRRNDHDVGKLPLFGVLVMIFGEWLPLLVPFIPNAVPSTCRIPKQQRQMQEKTEERRRRAFMLGVSEPSAEQWSHQIVRTDTMTESRWPAAFDPRWLHDIVIRLRPDQLYHLSCTLGLHKHIWDRLQLPPPSFLLRRAILKRLLYLAQDDLMLLLSNKSSTNQEQSRSLRKTDKPTWSLSPDELRIALSERGFDVLGYGDNALRERLDWWLERQARDEGQGRVMFGMLFRRFDSKEAASAGKRGRR